jgi:peptidyl-prolyl cis-trans isomerase C
MNLKHPLAAVFVALSAAMAVSISPSFAADAPASPAASAKPLAVVNGVQLPPIYAHFVRQSRINRNGPPESLADEALRDAVITAELLSQEAVRKGLDSGPTLKAAIEFQKKDLLSQALIEDYLRAHPISDEVLKAEYDKAKEKAGSMEYRVSHILVSSEKEAREIITKLRNNKKLKFDDLAKKQSKDSSAGNGGDLGWMLPGNLVPEFAEAMVKLKPKETVKAPVQTKFGWHVIQLQETRKLDFPEFDKLKNRIAAQMQQHQLRRYVQELRASARVE